MATVLHNVHDKRAGRIGPWEIAPLDVDALSEADIGRTVIYRDHGRAEAGTLTSWRGNTVFARYSTGDTSAGANAADLVFGVRAIDPRDPDPSRPGIFAAHNCARCRDGALPCVRGTPTQCEYPHARND